MVGLCRDTSEEQLLRDVDVERVDWMKISNLTVSFHLQGICIKQMLLSVFHQALIIKSANIYNTLGTLYYIDV